MYYLLFIWNDVEPQLYGPYGTPDERDVAAKELRAAEGPDHGIYMLDTPTYTGEVVVESYCASFFDD